jgi:hypothetical protein
MFLHIHFKFLHIYLITSSCTNTNYFKNILSLVKLTSFSELIEQLQVIELIYLLPYELVRIMSL